MPSMDEQTTPDSPKNPTSPAPSSAANVSEPKPKSAENQTPVADRLPTWLKFILVVLPLVAVLISLCSLGVSCTSLRYSMGYTRQYEDHDVVARVLGVKAVLKGWSATSTNAELTVDVAIINRGNQTEIIREAFLCYSETNDFNGNGIVRERGNSQTSIQLNKGDRRVLHLSTPFSSYNTNKRQWLGIALRAVAPNADDIEVVWPVCTIELVS